MYAISEIYILHNILAFGLEKNAPFWVSNSPEKKKWEKN